MIVTYRYYSGSFLGMGAARYLRAACCFGSSGLFDSGLQGWFTRLTGRLNYEKLLSIRDRDQKKLEGEKMKKDDTDLL